MLIYCMAGYRRYKMTDEEKFANESKKKTLFFHHLSVLTYSSLDYDTPDNHLFIWLG